jgi:hypothetical protein
MEIVIVKDYQTENKIIGDLYKKFKEQYLIPYNLLETISTCKYFNYYNSDDDKQVYFHMWDIKKSTIFFKTFSQKKYNFYKEISNENQINNNIQRDHYLDCGCICKSCCYKRYNILYKIKKGEYVDIKIIHEQAVYEKKNIIKSICKNIINKSVTSSLKKLKKI